MSTILFITHGVFSVGLPKELKPVNNPQSNVCTLSENSLNLH